jgi:hypothetical protein
MPNLTTQTAVIASGVSISGVIETGQLTPCAIQLPSAWTTAGITFAVSLDGATYGPLKNQAGTEVLVTAPDADDVINLDPKDFGAVRYFKIRSGTEGSPVNQGAARSIIVCSRFVP